MLAFQLCGRDPLGSLLAALLWDHVTIIRALLSLGPATGQNYFSLAWLQIPKLKCRRRKGRSGREPSLRNLGFLFLAAACWGKLLALPQLPGAWLTFLSASRGHDSGSGVAHLNLLLSGVPASGFFLKAGHHCPLKVGLKVHVEGQIPGGRVFGPWEGR